MNNNIKRFLKGFFPPSSNTVNGRLDNIEDSIMHTYVNQNALLEAACWSNVIQELHKDTFKPYKNIYSGKDIVLVATGPTLNYYVPIQDAVHIGVNGSYTKNTIMYDYYFVLDYRGQGRTFDLEKICKMDCRVFLGKYVKRNFALNMEIPEFYFQNDNVSNFYVMPLPSKPIIYPDIEYFALMDWHSITFPAINFALYTNPKRLFLVGCDSSSNDHFNKTIAADLIKTDKLVAGYKAIHKFTSCYYPNTKIISVNPVALKGIFDDVYTESYLTDYPDIKKRLGSNNYKLLCDIVNEGDV